MKKYLLIILSIILLWSCNKTTLSKPSPLVGSWNFSKAYSVWNFSLTPDSVYITFDNLNKYQFIDVKSPVDNGSYSIGPDSLLIIQPGDPSYSSFYTITHFTAPYNQATMDAYSVDQYYYSINSKNQLLIKRKWILKSYPGYTYTESFEFTKR
ncbi:MAG TPA: hypothetical protein DGG95_02865 [Cytophagales bacterium]|jgi:hypothetical protein|nr:hypothetical protein [Cytophagales bacterium]